MIDVGDSLTVILERNNNSAEKRGETLTAVAFLILKDRIKIIKKEDKKEPDEEIDNKEDSIDEIVTKEEGEMPRLERDLLYNISETKAVDYESLFSYLANSVKQNEFEHNSYFGYDRPAGRMQEDFFNPKYDEETMREVIRAKKIKDMFGVEVYINPMKKSLFDVWKLGNGSQNKLLYDVTNVM